MANVRIVDLPAGVTPTGAEPFETVQSGSSVSLTLRQIISAARQIYDTAAVVTAANIMTLAAGGPAAIKTAGHFTAGDYGGATYIRVSSGGQLTSADGQSWQIADLEPYANAFGATGNGTTDDTPAIQACLDFVMNNGRYKARLAPGNYKTSDTVHVGYGWGPAGGRYCRIVLEGETGFTPGAQGSLNPTKILPTFQDRPVINIQGVQQGGVRKLHIKGPGTLAGFIAGFGNPTSYNVLQMANRANFVPVLAGVNASTFQNSPFCGVCIDGYLGTAPANPYPTPNYPSWISSDPPPSAPYGVIQSTDCFVEGCTIEGTLIGIMNQPNGVANGDFMSFRDNKIVNCQDGIVIGGSQARNTVYDRTDFFGCHTCINGFSYGSGGNISGSMNDLTTDFVYQLFVIDGSWAKGVNVTNFYSESSVRIGATVGSPVNITIQDSTFSCANFTSTTQLLMWPLYEGAGYVKFLNSKVGGMWGVALINTNCSFEGLTTQLQSGPSAALEIAAYAKNKNVLLSGFTTDTTRNLFLDCNMNGQFYTGYGTSSWHDVGYAGLGQLDYALSGHQSATQLSFTSVVWTNRTFTATANVSYCAVGDVLYSSNLGWCVLTAVSGTSISATMISNYQLDSSTYTMLKSDGLGSFTVRTDTQMNADFASLAPYYFPINIFDWTPTFNTFWKATAGSNVLACVLSDGVTANNIPAGITTSSKVLWSNAGSTVAPGLPFPLRVAVTAVNAQSLTMSANALNSGMWLTTPYIARVA